MQKKKQFKNIVFKTVLKEIEIFKSEKCKF